MVLAGFGAKFRAHFGVATPVAAIKSPVVGRCNLLPAEQKANNLRVLVAWCSHIQFSNSRADRRFSSAVPIVNGQSTIVNPRGAVRAHAPLHSPVGYLFCALKTVTWRYGRCGNAKPGQ